MKLISKIAYIHVEIQELVHESKLTALNKLLDESTNLYGERIAELEKERDEQKIKKEHSFKRERHLLDENLELKRKTFRRYNGEECWIFQDDGEDYQESLVCPVVMSADQFRRLLNLELNIEARNLEQQAKGRLDGVAYALNMYCTTMTPKDFPSIGDYYANKLKVKELKAGE